MLLLNLRTLIKTAIDFLKRLLDEIQWQERNGKLIIHNIETSVYLGVIPTKMVIKIWLKSGYFIFRKISPNNCNKIGLNRIETARNCFTAHFVKSVDWFANTV